jgi:peptidoglycan/xylan/chitin deacetylase (PgdA/CDA1 family)
VDIALRCFPEGRRKALTLSFDDGKVYDRKLVALINKYGVKCTFNINSGSFGFDEGFGAHLDKDEAAELYKGHEIAVHTVNHPTLTRCSKEQIVLQVLDDRKNLEKIVNKTVRGMAYPNVDGFNNEIKSVLPHIGIDYARITGSTMNFLLPKDLYQWQFTCDYRHDLIKNAEDFNNLYKPQYLYLMSVYGHSIDFEKDNYWGEFEKYLQKASKKQDVWYCTNIEYVDYMNAFDSLRFSVDNTFVENPTNTVCWISVNNEIVEIPPGKVVYGR